MDKETKIISESSLIIKNLSELEAALKNLSMKSDVEKTKKLVFLASLLIEKIIFYYQLSKGVEYIGVYKYSPSSSEAEPVNVKNLYKFYKKLDLENGLSLSKLIRLRSAIANIYIQYSNKNRGKSRQNKD